MPENHPHGKNARTNTLIVRYIITDSGPAGSVHDEADVSFDSADFDISFVSGKHVPRFIVVVIDKGLDADCCSLAVVGNLLIGDAGVIKVFQCLRCFPDRKSTRLNSSH